MKKGLTTVEARTKTSTYVQPNVLRNNILGYILENLDSMRVGREVDDWRGVGILDNTLERVWVAEACESFFPSGLPWVGVLRDFGLIGEPLGKEEDRTDRS